MHCSFQRHPLKTNSSRITALQNQIFPNYTLNFPNPHVRPNEKYPVLDQWMGSLRCGLTWNGAWGLSRLRLKFQDVGSVVLDFEGFRIQNHGIMKCKAQVKQLSPTCTRKDTTSSPCLCRLPVLVQNSFPQCPRERGMTSHSAV